MCNPTRICFGLLLGLAAGLLLLVRPTFASPDSQQAVCDTCWAVLGFSQGGVPLVVHRLGTSSTRLLLVGGQHGGPESNTIELASRLLGYFSDNPGELPGGLGLDVLVVANPDGAATGSRQFLSGVDPNRNWGTADWQPDGWDSNARFRPGLGGPTPFSEQETRALRDWILESRPVVVINYHSAGGFMFGQSELAELYAAASGYYFPRPGGGGPRLLGYRVTGSTNAWLREQGVAGILVELSTPYDPEVGRNLAGVRAVLRFLADSSSREAKPARADFLLGAVRALGSGGGGGW